MQAVSAQEADDPLKITLLRKNTDFCRLRRTKIEYIGLNGRENTKKHQKIRQNCDFLHVVAMSLAKDSDYFCTRYS